MSSSNPPTEDPTEFNNLQFNPIFFNTDEGSGISQITADGRYLLKKQPDTAIAVETFSAGINTNAISSFQPTTNMTIGNNLTTGNLVLGNTDIDTIVEGNLKPTNRITTSGLLAPTTSSSCALFNNLLTNTIFIGNALQENYKIQMGSNNGNITMNGKNIQLGTDDETQTIKCVAKLKSNSLEPITVGDTLSVGETASQTNLNGITVGVTQATSDNSTRLATTSYVKSVIAENETTFLTESNTFSGIVNFTNDSTCKTQATSNNSTRLANTFFVKSAISGNEETFLTASNTFSGIVNFTNDSTCKTQTTVSNSTRIASTAFVKNAIAGNQTTFLASSPAFSGTLTTNIIKTNSIRSPSSVIDLNLGTVDTQNINLGKTGQYLTINSQQVKLGTGAPIDGCLSIHATESAFRNCIRLKSAWDGQMYFIQFTNEGGTDIGAIGNYGSGVSYMNYSDRRLKEDIEPMDSTLDRIMALKPSKYKWKSTGDKGVGFIAQEVFQQFPEMRTCVPKATNPNCDCPVDEDGKEVYHGLDYGKFSPQIIKALQEMKQGYDAKIASLEERLKLLETN